MPLTDGPLAPDQPPLPPTQSLARGGAPSVRDGRTIEVCELLDAQCEGISAAQRGLRADVSAVGSVATKPDWARALERQMNAQFAFLRQELLAAAPGHGPVPPP